MTVTFDFKIIGQTGIPNLCLIEAQNEDAYNFVVDEELLTTLPDGSAVLCQESIEDFIGDAEHAQMCCQLS